MDNRKIDHTVAQVKSVDEIVMNSIFNMGKIVAMLEALEKDVSETEEYLSDFYDEVGL